MVNPSMGFNYLFTKERSLGAAVASLTQLRLVNEISK